MNIVGYILTGLVGIAGFFGLFQWLAGKR